MLLGGAGLAFVSTDACCALRIFDLQHFYEDLVIYRYSSKIRDIEWLLAHCNGLLSGF